MAEIPIVRKPRSHAGAIALFVLLLIIIAAVAYWYWYQPGSTTSSTLNTQGSYALTRLTGWVA